MGTGNKPAVCLVWMAGAVGGMTCAPGRADVVDLTTANSSGTINGAIFSTAAPHAAGTGFIDSFVRIRNNGAESGYNTSIPSQQFGRDEVGGNFTHDITLGEVGRVTEAGTEYYQFLLDINESSGQQRPLLSLDDVQIYTSPTAHTDYKMNLGDLGAPVYTMDTGGDNRVELNYDLNPQLQGPGGGSGTGDMVMLVPVSAFGGAGPDTFVYLYSLFGEHNAADAGFEEWWTRNPEIIPLPPAVIAGMFGLASIGAGFWLRRRSHNTLLD